MDELDSVLGYLAAIGLIVSMIAIAAVQQASIPEVDHPRPPIELQSAVPTPSGGQEIEAKRKARPPTAHVAQETRKIPQLSQEVANAHAEAAAPAVQAWHPMDID